jgi:hypothetical protein
MVCGSSHYCTYCRSIADRSQNDVGIMYQLAISISYKLHFNQHIPIRLSIGSLYKTKRVVEQPRACEDGLCLINT